MPSLPEYRGATPCRGISSGLQSAAGSRQHARGRCGLEEVAQGAGLEEAAVREQATAREQAAARERASRPRRAQVAWGILGGSAAALFGTWLLFFPQLVPGLFAWDVMPRYAQAFIGAGDVFRTALFVNAAAEGNW